MNYEDTIAFLFSQLPMFQRIGKAAYKANLNNTLALDKYFNHPHRKYKTIHVAGTNGKGSLSHMLAAIMQSTGYSVGLYTSPHLLDFRERIRVNGKMIGKQQVVDFVENHKQIIKQLKPSFFEITVAMAFDHFEKVNVDVAIIEVGLGGRLDSTNIITPEISIITNIGYDHMFFLGDTLKQIAGEKAGIIKPGVPVIVGETQEEIEHVFIQKANENMTTIEYADQTYKIDYSLLSSDNKQVFNVKNTNHELIFENLSTDLLGSYQKQNLVTALAAVKLLKRRDWKIFDKAIYKGLNEVVMLTGLKGRWQILENDPLIICDTGHNKEGIQKIIDQIKNTAYKRLHFIFGMVDDKTTDTILQLLPKDALYYFTKASVPRALNEHTLTENATKYALNGKTFSTVEEAIYSAKQSADKNDLIFIGGSTFVVADALAHFTNT
jgi:dihydrofolate synthase/folylpolyglutamate synthase